MANIYLRSTDGLDADNGSTWALANATAGGATADMIAGDTLNVSYVHNETTTGVTVTFPGTTGSPNKVLSVNDSAAPPTTLQSGAVIGTSSGSLLLAGNFYAHGITFRGGTASSGVNLDIASGTTATQRYENCILYLGTASTSAQMRFGPATSNAARDVRLRNCTLRFSATAQSAYVYNCRFSWEGGDIIGSPSVLFRTGCSNGTGEVIMSGINLTNAPASVYLFACVSGTGPGKGLIRNSKLPASWSGGLVFGTMTVGSRFEMHNCNAGAVHYGLAIEDWFGKSRISTVNYRNGGAGANDVPLSWYMEASGDAEYPAQVMLSHELTKWNEVTSGTVNVTVEIISDGMTLTDEEVWLDVQYLSDATAPLSTFVTNAKADVFATATAHPSSSETWTTVGFTTPIKQKLTVAITPKMKGVIHARVAFCKAATYFYVDPKITLT